MLTADCKSSKTRLTGSQFQNLSSATRSQYDFTQYAKCVPMSLKFVFIRLARSKTFRNSYICTRCLTGHQYRLSCEIYNLLGTNEIDPNIWIELQLSNNNRCWHASRLTCRIEAQNREIESRCPKGRGFQSPCFGLQFCMLTEKRVKQRWLLLL